MVARARVWGCVLGACVVAGATGMAAASTRSGVLHGTALAAPAAPVCMPRVPCLRPAAGVVLVFARAGVVRARATTAVDGSYRVSLAPGAYRVRVTQPANVPRLTPTRVFVAAGEAKRVNFYLETGIR